MELFLNVCWLALLLPAFLLWRRSALSQPSARTSFVIICTLGCVLVLLFPIISASDDLHSVGQAMEESKHSFRHGGHCACASHSISHALLPDLPPSVSLKVVFEQIGFASLSSPHAFDSVLAKASAGRAPPYWRIVSL